MTDSSPSPQQKSPPERRRWLEVIGIVIGVLEIVPDNSGGARLRRCARQYAD